MGAIDNLNGDEMRSLVKRIERLERQASTGFTNVSRGALRITSAEGLIVDGSEKVTGTLDVTGTLTVSGTLNGDGTVDWTGPVTFTGATNLDGPIEVNGASHFVGLATVDGDMNVNGTLTVNGPAGVNGQLYITGNTELTGDLTVDGAGSIILGTIVFNPTGGPGGSGLISSATSIQVNAPTLAAQNAIFAGGDITANGTFVAGTMPIKSGVTANVWCDPATGRLYRVN